MSKTDSLSICPYYHADLKNYIGCEGLEEGQNIQIKFSLMADKQNWMKRYCKRMAYCACPIAQMIAVQRYREVMSSPDLEEGKKCRHQKTQRKSNTCPGTYL